MAVRLALSSVSNVESLLDFPDEHWDNYYCPFGASLGVFSVWRKFESRRANH